MLRPPGRQRRFHSTAAIVSTTFSEGICPDLLSILDHQEEVERRSDSDESPRSSPRSSRSRSPVIRSPRHRAERLFSGASSPFSPSEVESPDGVFKSPKISRFGFFPSPFKTRRSSAPPVGGEPACREAPFKPDMLAVAEHDDESRRSASVGHSPVHIFVSSSEDDVGNKKLRKRRDFSSTGDLLGGELKLKETKTYFSSTPLKKYLGKSLEHVSAVSVVCCSCSYRIVLFCFVEHCCWFKEITTMVSGIDCVHTKTKP